MWLYRNRGEKDYKIYLKSFEMMDTTETNIPRLQIFKSCPVLIDAIKACAYAKSKDGKVAEDIAEFVGDDPIDGLRYLVDSAEQFFNESADEFKKIQAQEAQAELLRNSQDWTAFYRNMKKIESGDSTLPVKRYHRRSH